jgi:hypothetical protein
MYYVSDRKPTILLLKGDLLIKLLSPIERAHSKGMIFRDELEENRFKNNL